MKEIRIRFYPIVQRAELWSSGQLVDPSANTVARRLKSHPPETWLRPYRSGYQLWRGLLMELMDDMDDDKLEITVEGPLDFFRQVEETFAAQRQETDDMGFRHDAYALYHQDRWDLAFCKQFTETLYDQSKKYMKISTQEEAILKRELEKALASCTTYGALHTATQLLVKLWDIQSESRGISFADQKIQIREELWGEY